MASRARARLQAAPRLVRSWLESRFRRRFPVDPKRILIAHHLLLGDTLMLAPLLKKLHTLYPRAEIVMATPKAVVPLFAGQPYGVRALPYDPRDPASVDMLAAERGFDLALIPGDNRYSWLAYALGARYIVAHAGDRPAYKSWPVDRQVAYRSQPAPWFDMVCDLVPGPSPMPYHTDEWPTPRCLPFDRPTGDYAVLHLGASSALKLWPEARWRELAQRLEQQGIQPVWSAGPKETALVDAIDPRGMYPSFAGKLDLAQMWHLLADSRLLVCPDTGVAHIGKLCGTPTVTLFGPGSASLYGAGEFWAAMPYRALTVDPFECRDQHLLFKRDIAWVRRCSRTTTQCQVPRCMQALDLERVWQTCSELLHL